ncbi:MAG: zinc-ribbon domain-containing protein [Xanthobacteraceae bacterium]|nr:zinc-ribbon domain-containing protein [Xanthobacteraceae bacterium]
MHITCPHCTTSYAVDPANFSAGGRTVRCARCQETWLARPDGMAAAAQIHERVYAAEASGQDGEGSWDRQPPEGDWQDQNPPHIDSPPLSGDWGISEHDKIGGGVASNDGWADEPAPGQPRKWLGGLGRFAGSRSRPILGAMSSLRAKLPLHLAGKINLPRACAVMGAMVFALVVWRTEVVRLMPQTAAFFKIAGLGVNLRGLSFEDVKITTETVNGKPVLVIEGAIADTTRKPVELPRLRFIVRDGQGSDIYAWNSVLEQPVLNPGEKVWFKSRLASPPAEGREIIVRFFLRRDILAGGV